MLSFSFKVFTVTQTYTQSNISNNAHKWHATVVRFLVPHAIVQASSSEYYNNIIYTPIIPQSNNNIIMTRGRHTLWLQFSRTSTIASNCFFFHLFGRKRHLQHEHRAQYIYLATIYIYIYDIFFCTFHFMYNVYI